MVNTRAYISKRPVFPYGSRGYTLLCYGAMRRCEFTSADAKNCLQGTFPRKNNNDILETSNRLASAGLLIKIERNRWLITEKGKKAMYEAAAYNKEYLWRTVGFNYVEEMTEKIKKVFRTSESIMDKLDKEELLLLEIENKVTKRKKHL